MSMAVATVQAVARQQQQRLQQQLLRRLVPPSPRSHTGVWKSTAAPQPRGPGDNPLPPQRVGGSTPLEDLPANPSEGGSLPASGANALAEHIRPAMSLLTHAQARLACLLSTPHVQEATGAAAAAAEVAAVEDALTALHRGTSKVCEGEVGDFLEMGHKDGGWGRGPLLGGQGEQQQNRQQQQQQEQQKRQQQQREQRWQQQWQWEWQWRQPDVLMLAMALLAGGGGGSGTGYAVAACDAVAGAGDKEEGARGELGADGQANRQKQCTCCGSTTGSCNHSKASMYLTRDAIANAVAAAAPAVVNLTVSVGRGMFSGQSMGSGFIVRSDGLILTNAHVVAEVLDATPRGSAASGGGGSGGSGSRGTLPAWNPRTGMGIKLVVSLHDGRTFDGEVVGYDLRTDVALVKVTSSTPLPVVRLGSSKALRPGDWVVALGSPLHLSNTVTAGIVSCVDRKGSELGLQGGHTDFIQTDAAINAGNSGGPLLNLDGEVVGISNMKALAADGISFAVPIDTVVTVMDQLGKHGRVVRPFLGIKMLELNPAIIAQLRERDPTFPDVQYGVLVPQVVAGSPAAAGGMRPGDVIVELQGQPIKSVRQIVDILSDKVGQEFHVVVKRAGNHTRTLSFITDECSDAV